MSAIEKLHDAGDGAAARPSASEVTGWLLEGRWFTIGADGNIGSWSPAAAEQFGWQRGDVDGQSFVETLVAPAGRSAASAAVDSALAGAAADHAGFTGEVEAVDSS